MIWLVGARLLSSCACRRAHFVPNRLTSHKRSSHIKHTLCCYCDGVMSMSNCQLHSMGVSKRDLHLSSNAFIMSSNTAVDLSQCQIDNSTSWGTEETHRSACCTSASIPSSPPQCNTTFTLLLSNRRSLCDRPSPGLVRSPSTGCTLANWLRLPLSISWCSWLNRGLHSSSHTR